MSFLQGLGAYLVVGVIFNLADVLRGLLFHKGDFQNFVSEMKAFGIRDAIGWCAVYIVIWPILLCMEAADAIGSAAEKIGFKKKQ